MIKVDITFPKDFPKFDMSDALLEIAEKVFIPKIQENMDKEIDIKGVGYPPLADSTLKSKLRRSLSPMILHAENRLRNAFNFKARSKNVVVISINQDRKEIGDILQNKGVRSKIYGKRYFHFFDTNPDMEKGAVRTLYLAIEKEIKDAGFK